jgi:hypothetical protein
VADIAEFEDAIVSLNSRPIVVLGSSLSPDGRYGAALIRLPTATDYVLNTVYASTPEGWKDHTGGNGDIQWVSLGRSGGVMAYGGEAPHTATAARVLYEGVEHTVPIRHGHFFFVSWDTNYDGEPTLLGFD